MNKMTIESIFDENSNFLKFLRIRQNEIRSDVKIPPKMVCSNMEKFL